MLEGGRVGGIAVLLRNLFLAALLYACIFGVIQLAQAPSLKRSSSTTSPAEPGSSPPNGDLELLPEIIGGAGSSLKVRLAGTNKVVNINPHANAFNRPESAVLPKDDYLGSRPHVDTVADLQLVVQQCRGSYVEEEKTGYVHECLHFLDKEEGQYYSLPPKPERASAQDPRRAEFRDADGHDNTKDRYVSVGSAETASRDSVGTCPGPIIPYHTYWTGPATWRVEVFIKSYLYTQNLACSRLHLWLDSDRNPEAVGNMLDEDPIFAQFLPLVERGDIILESWQFPDRIALPNIENSTDGEFAVADGVTKDADGQQWLTLSRNQMSFLPVAVSDAVRFIVLHQYGGMYFDMDVLMLRDMRPLVLAKEHNWAERWGGLKGPLEYNTAIMSLKANSSLSSYLLRGAVRIGLNFHPRILGMMLWKDGRSQEFLKFETGAFDPIWTVFQSKMEGRCTIPCLKDYGAVFKGKANAIKNEWESYEGPQLPLLGSNTTSSPVTNKTSSLATNGEVPPSNRLRANLTSSLITNSEDPPPHRAEMRKKRRMITPNPSDGLKEPAPATPADLSMGDAFSTTNEEEDNLRHLRIVDDYIISEDKYPPNNRTLENFFRGTWTYHIHNQWSKHPEPSSWLDVIQKAHDGFFERRRVNPYGERWEGPDLRRYNRWPEFI